MPMRHIYDENAFDPDGPVGSYWQAATEKPAIERPQAGSDEVYDAVIIGGGYTGQSAAIYLAEHEGMQVAIADAAEPGWGASGRNGGFCCVGGDKLSYPKMIRRYGLDTTRDYCRIQQQAVAMVSEVAERAGIDLDRCGEGEFQLAHKPGAIDGLKEEAELLRSRLGMPAEILDRDQLRARGLHGETFHGGLHLAIGFGLNPLEYDYGLYRHCRKVGVAWHTHTPVTGWNRHGRLIHLQTPSGELKTRRVLVATNGYTPEDLTPALRGRLLPVLSNILVTRPLSEAERAQQGWTSHTMCYDSRNLLHYFRLLPDHRFLFGGRGGTSAAPETLASMQTRLTRTFAEFFPAWRDVEVQYFWRGFACLSWLRTPHVCQLDDDVYAAVAYHGNGVAMGTWAGEQLGRLAAGAPHEIPAFMKRPPRAFPFAALRKLYLRAAYFGYQLMDEYL